MRRLPAPVEPPPPPPKPPKLGAKPTDSPKLGEDKLPTGGPRFTRLNWFWKLSETFMVKRLSLGGAPPPCGPAPGPTPATLPPPPPTPVGTFGPPVPPAGRLGAPVVVGCPCDWAAALFRLLMVPNANVRLTRILTTTEPGALPKLRGTIVSPGNGTRLKMPNGVQRMFGAEQSAFAAAKLGRSFTWRSRFKSCPVMMLNGGPLFATTNGFSTRFHHGRFTVPKIVKRCRTSNRPRLNSPDVSYELIGNSAPPWPSVSLVVLLKE